MSTEKPSGVVSVVTPAYFEEDNLPIMFDRLSVVFEQIGQDWEWLIVDDHSGDKTFEVAKSLAIKNHRVRVVRLSRNCGSHAAILCGVSHSRGDCVIVLSADLQDPPSVLGDLISKWRDGDQIVWAVRKQRDSDGLISLFFSKIFYKILAKLDGLKETPALGSDFFLIDTKVVDALSAIQERNINVFALIQWMGFRQSSINYERQERMHGHSGWTISKKISLFVDSVVAFSFLPIRIMLILGFVIATLGFSYAIFIITNFAIHGAVVEGWSSLMIAILISGGLNLIMLGMLGEYIWRVLVESRNRPRFFIEDVAGSFHDQKDK